MTSIGQATLVVVDAPAGYGKGQLLDRIEDDLGPACRLHDMASLAQSEGGASVTIVDNLTSDDDAHFIEEALRGNLFRRLVIAGRGLSRRVRALGSGPDRQLVEARHLAMTADQIESYLTGSASDVRRAAREIEELSAGWPPLATALIDLAATTDLAISGSVTAAVSAAHELMSPILERLDPDQREALIQAAILPWLDHAVVALIGGSGVAARFVNAGVPMTRGPDNSLDLPPAVRESLSRGADLDPSIASRVAPLLAEKGQAIAAARMLYRTGGAATACRFLAQLPASIAGSLSAHEFAAVLELFGDEPNRWPRLLLWRARLESNETRLEQQRYFLERAAVAGSGAGVEDVRAEARAELLFLRAIEGGYSEALNDEILAEIRSADGDDHGRGNRLAEAHAVVLASKETSDALEKASLIVDRVARTWEGLGEPDRAGAAWRLLSVQSLIPLGRYIEAEAAMTRASRLAADEDLDQARNVVVQARIAALGGRPDLAEHLDRADALAASLGLGWIAAYAMWTRMLAEANEQHGRAALELHERAWSQLGELRDHSTGLVFLAESATSLARCDLTDVGSQLIDSARHRRCENMLEFDIAELAVSSRSAPLIAVKERAENLLATGRVPIARRWTILLYLAVAMWRAGDPSHRKMADIAAVEAKLCGLGDRPGQLEPHLFTLPSSAEIGMASLQSDSEVPDIAIALLGRFAVRLDGREVSVASERAVTLIKILATRGGSAPVDLVIDTIWPEIDPTVGRRRLKNVVSRARADLGPIVIRERERIALCSSVSIDLNEFDLAAKQAALLAQTDPEAAGEVCFQALDLYHGELLPDDRYSDWVESLRIDIKSRAVALVDIILAGHDVESSPELAVAAAEIMLRVDSADSCRLADIASRCSESGNDATASVLLERVRHETVALGLD